jgi:hypothetical protein
MRSCKLSFTARGRLIGCSPTTDVGTFPRMTHGRTKGIQSYRLGRRGCRSAINTGGEKPKRCQGSDHAEIWRRSQCNCVNMERGRCEPTALNIPILNPSGERTLATGGSGSESSLSIALFSYLTSGSFPVGFCARPSRPFASLATLIR